jgi:heme/copper-type cytochrome/quinol oxidase subunit 2
LITATIPVTWAISIIISESTDSMDYYDGFKTTELIIGIRAYQWGWEYYYPKDIDTQYNLNQSYSEFLGNSLKYNTTSEKKAHTTKMLNFLKKTTNSNNSNLSNLILLPNNNKFFNNKLLAKTPLELDNTFKNITKYTKNINSNLYQSNNFSDNSNLVNFNFNKNSNLKINNFKIIKNYNLLSTKSYLNNSNNLIDLKLINKLNKLKFNNVYDNRDLNLPTRKNLFLLNKINFNKFNYINY